jgi:hypothetical protein
MEAIGLLVTLEARSGKEADAEAFLRSAQPLALNESGTLKWYAIKLGPWKFGIFDTFANEAGRNGHLTGEIAKTLGARANELFATPPQVERVEILASTPLKNYVGAIRIAGPFDCGIRASTSKTCTNRSGSLCDFAKKPTNSRGECRETQQHHHWPELADA